MNISAGVALSSQPQRLADLESMQSWGARWLLEGQQIYRVRSPFADHPPNAIVLLSPLALLPPEAAAAIWLMLNVAIAVLAPYLAARFFRPHDPFRVVLLPILMFLCWGGVRTLTGFSLAALTLSVAAMRLADRTRAASGVLLGFALMKPPVAVPVFLWSVFARRWIVALTAGATAAALVAIYCLRSSADPFWLIVRYVAALARYHTGDAMLSGRSELRPLILQIVNDPSHADAIAAAVALGLVAAICVAGLQEGAGRRRTLYAAPPLVACWSLLTFYAVADGFVILLPVLMLLALDDSEPSRLRIGLLWLLQLGMMFDVPGLSLGAGLADTGLHLRVLAHVDRALVVVLFFGLIVLAWKESDYEPRMRAARNS